jgi:hypothetical protein
LLSHVPVVKEISKLAPSEGGFYTSSLAKAYVKGVTQGMRDAYDVWKKGGSDIKELYNTRNPEPYHWTQFFGMLHEIEKSPLRRAAFELSLDKRIRNGIKNGIDVADEATSLRMMMDAYKDSNRALLLEPNKGAEWIRSLSSKLEAKDKATGRVSLLGKAGATMVRTEIPIATVPLNFAKQTLEGVFGLPLGAGRAASAWFRGFDELAKHPEEADAIMRNLKNGSVGGAIALYAFLDGYYGWNHFGGYFEPGDKRRTDDAKFGTVKFGNYWIPTVLLHHPLLEVGMLANTAGRLMRPKTKKQASVPAVVIASLLGLMEHSPLGSEAMEFSKMAYGAARWDAIDKHVASYIGAQGLKNLAEWTDTETARRKPRNLVEHIEMGIPGLRQNVPKERYKPKTR